MSNAEAKKSPPWGNTAKIIVGLTLVAIVAAFLYRFSDFIAPLLLTFILIYLLYPVVSYLSERTRLSWQWTVNLIFIVLIILLLATFTLTGVAVVGQLQSVIAVVERFVNTLPQTVMEWSTTQFQIGPFEVDMSDYLAAENLQALIQQAISIVQPLLGQAGGILRSVAAVTASTFTWGVIVLIISYFILEDMHKVSDQDVDIEIPGYDYDIRRMGREMGRIWDAYLRGQLILFALTVVIYLIILSILGVRYALALAFLAGLARFVPYVGPWVTWISTALVSLLQRSNYFGLEMWQYMILVVAIALIIDQIFDSMVAPRILGKSLGVHPAAVLIAALVGANLIGIVGIVLASPVLATLTLWGKYVTRKMLDLEPWPEPEQKMQPIERSFSNWGQQIWQKIKSLFKRNREE